MPGQLDTHTEYRGPVGFEKKDHKTHFNPLENGLRQTDYDTGYRWIETRPGRWERVKRLNGDNVIHNTA